MDHKFIPTRKRTITFSVIFVILALFSQADSQGIIDLSPMLGLIVNALIVVVGGSVPVWLRKAVEDSKNKGIEKKK